MKKIIFLISILLLIILFVIKRNCNIKKNELYSIKAREEEVLKIDREKKYAYENLKFNNIIGYCLPQEYETVAADIAYKDYNVILVLDYNEMQKRIMDSVIFSKFGRDFYQKIQNEATDFLKKKGEKIYPDGNYIESYVSFDNAEKYKIQDYVKKKIKESGFIKENSILKDFYYDLVIDKNGKVKDVRILFHRGDELDSLIINSLNNLPFELSIGTVDGKPIDFRITNRFSFENFNAID